MYLLNSALSSSLTSIMHHNGCVNGYVIKRLSDVLTLYLSNKTLTYVLTLSSKYDQYTVVWTAQDPEKLNDETGIRHPNYVRMNVPLRADELNRQNEIHTYVKLLFEKRGKEFGVGSNIIGERCLSSTEFSITMES